MKILNNMSNLQEKFKNEITPQLRTKLERKNILETPKILKVTINSGLSVKRDAKFIETLQTTIRRISGQEPVVTKARKSIAGFKVREGMPVGAMVTLRSARMWSFIEKLVSVIFPRIRDFQGIPLKAVDKDGNFSYGFKEHVAFPEIHADGADALHGLQVNITTTAKTHEEGIALFEALGFPFTKKIVK